MVSNTKTPRKRSKYIPTAKMDSDIRRYIKGDRVFVPYADYIYEASITKMAGRQAYVRFKENDYPARYPISKLKRSKKVFIIESAGEKRFDRGFSEGKLLVEFLKMIGCDAEYNFIRPEKELRFFFRKAAKSTATHIHLCMHGNKDSLVLVLENLPIDELIDSAGNLSGKVVFASTCLMGHKEFGQRFADDTVCDAFIAPLFEISWPSAAIVSQLFYKSIFCNGSSPLSAYRYIRKHYEENAGLRIFTPQNQIEQ